MSQSALHRTPLHALCMELGARMVAFGGWDMPVQFSSVLDEHRAVREACGLFDVSHMGEVSVTGPDALAALQYLTPKDVAVLEPGRVQNSALTTDAGTFADDILIYQLAEADYLLVVNAANIEKDLAWMGKHVSGDVLIQDRSPDFAMLALQGPRSVEVLAQLTETPLDTLRYYRHRAAHVAGVQTLVSRTGYTGEDGFELYLPASEAETVYRKLLDAGREAGIKPCGLAARDVLRLEAGMPLYGNDIDELTTVLEANLGFRLKLGKCDFLGAEALAALQQTGAPRKRVGLALAERGVARRGYPVHLNGATAGEVTSGTFSPSLQKSIGFVYLPSESAVPGKRIEVEIRGRRVAAEVVATPFYPHRTRRKKS